jgi:uncharacterized phiE125 gp8 family phage protein
VTAMLAAAREACENFTGRAITRKTYEIAFDQFPATNPQYQPIYGAAPLQANLNGPIELPCPPLVSISSFMVGTDSDAPVTASEYILDDYVSPPRLWPLTGEYWPSITTAKNYIKIRYIAGYGTDSDGDIPLPSPIKHAILLLLGAMYENREEEVVAAGNLIHLNRGIEFLLRPYRVKMGMA